MRKKQFVLEVALDRSYFEKADNRGRYHFVVKSVFLSFRAGTGSRNIKKAALECLDRFCRETYESDIVSTVVYQKLPRVNV